MKNINNFTANTVNNTSISIITLLSFSTLSPRTTNITPTMTTTYSVSFEDDIGSILTLYTIFTLILPYLIIFILSIVGNLLVIITLTLDSSMRSVTNIFLLNLAISDLLLGVFCMPVTLVGVLLRRFIFGPIMCQLISYFQAVSVAVSVWTLVAMSIERYYAICQPFRSRESRQTKKHAYRILALVWTFAFMTMSPTAIVSKRQLINNQTGFYKCREAWPSFIHKEVFTLFLDCVLLIIPLIIMIMTYSSIAITLRNNVKEHQNLEKNAKFSPKIINIDNECIQEAHYQTASFNNQCKNNCKMTTFNQRLTISTTPTNEEPTRLFTESGINHFEQPFKFATFNNNNNNNKDKNNLQIISAVKSTCNDQLGNILYSQHQRRTILRINTTSSKPYLFGPNRQRRIITMLFVMVIEFFICWTPIFILDTLALYQPDMVYGTRKHVLEWIGIDIISICHLLCFCSSCTNPITYCFMNHRFRNHFKSLFHCRTMKNQSNKQSFLQHTNTNTNTNTNYQNNSTLSQNF